MPICVLAAGMGVPQVVVIEADAGYGKTALLNEARKELSGWHVVASACDEAELRLPFGVLLRILDRIAPLQARELRALMSAANKPLDPLGLGPDLVQSLDDAQKTAPLAMLIDDAGWADEQSLKTLTFAFRRMETERLLVVLTVRPQTAGRLPQGLRQFAHDRGVTMRLGGFQAEEVRDLVAAMGRGEISIQAARRLVRTDRR